MKCKILGCMSYASEDGLCIRHYAKELKTNPRYKRKELRKEQKEI